MIDSDIVVGSIGGTGTLNVENSAQIDGTRLLVGTDPGSQGTVNVNTGGQLNVIVADANIGLNGGKGELNVTENGNADIVGGLQVGLNSGSQGTVNISSSTVDIGQFSSVGFGGTGTVTIDQNSNVDYVNSVHVGRDATGEGTFTLKGGSTGHINFVTIGRDGGTGVFNIEGEGTTFTTEGFAIGDEANSDGSLGIRGGAQVTIERPVNEQFPGINIARDSNSATGQVMIEGADGNGVGTSVLVRGNSAFVNVGRNGNGDLQVLEGASLNLESIDNAVGDPTNSILQIGRDSGAVGTMRISDAEVILSGTAERSFVRVGRQANSDGTLVIENGGKLTNNDDSAIFSIAHEAIAAQGIVTVSGSGSVYQNGNLNQDTTLGNETFTIVGRQGNGTLSIEDGGRVEGGVFVRVGNSTGSVGELNIDGKDAGGFASLLRLSGSGGNRSTGAESGQGAFLTVGLNGAGTTNITNGGKIVVDGGSVGDNFGFQAGRNDGSSGTINVVGEDSTIEIAGTQNGRINIGSLDGSTGVLNILDGASVVQNSSGTTFIGRSAGAVGTVVVSGSDGNGVGSLLDGGRFIGVGVELDEVTSGGTGTLTVSNGGQVVADTIAIGGNGLLNGSGGEITGDIIVFDGGIFAPGSSPGTFTINGAVTAQAGAIIQIEIGNTPNQSDFVEVTGALEFEDGVVLELVFADDFVPIDPIVITDFFTDDPALVSAIADAAFEVEFFSDAPAFDEPTFDVTTLLDTSKIGSGSVISDEVRDASETSTENILNQKVPEPGALALVGIGLVGLGLIGRQRKAA